MEKERTARYASDWENYAFQWRTKKEVHQERDLEKRLEASDM